MKYQMPDGMASEPEAAAGDLAPGVAARVVVALDAPAPGAAAQAVALGGLAPGAAAPAAALGGLAPGAAAPAASNARGWPWHVLSRILVALPENQP